MKSNNRWISLLSGGPADIVFTDTGQPFASTS